ncbi:3'-5' exonuclease [Paracrocinitomix mangrovi]|uniref:3'-5' exonuclease n=1 Tax=Paracrocinitomix mangrovi TaxID=2862509 RepID=UPI001C8DE7CA|nr:3'-5' exonuclease [Paracrocinitomix mangrovi]UKN03067.1 3'-5' exonuclease [Paracrocinitomix mangrovi]
MHLNLSKPIAFFDLETTGLNISNDRIVEIAILKIEPDHSEKSYTQRLNPEMEISEESISIHGITNEDVKDCPTFLEKAQEIKDFFGDADLAGYNSNKFDIPFLIEQFLANGIDFSMEGRKFVDVQNIFHKMEKRTLEAALKFYCEEDLENAHSAQADTIATYKVLKAQIERYEEVENDIDFLFEFSQTGKNQKIDFVGRLALNDDKEVIYNFGKHSGKTVAQVFHEEPGYHRWIIDNEFPLYTKKIVKDITDKLIQKNRAKKEAKKVQDEKQMINKLDQLKNKFNQEPK